MNIKLLILGALAYALISRKNEAKATEPAVKAPTQAEINAQLMKQAQAAVEQAEQVMSSF